MRGLITIVLLVAFGATAVAKPAPIERPRPTLALNDADINITSAGVTRERDYFQASQPQFNAGGLLCRLPLVVFDKTHLASSCR